MGKWTRRTFLAAGALTGGGLIFGVAIRPGNRTPGIAKLMEQGDEILVNAWVKLLPDNSITVIVPHVEMGQGAPTALAMMLAEDLDADWDTVSVEEAPAHKEYVTADMARDFIFPQDVPGFMSDSVDGAFLKLSQIMSLQITGGSYSVRGTGVRTMRVAGAAVRKLLIKAAAEDWGVPESEIRTEKSYVYHDASKQKAPYVRYAKYVASHKPDGQAEVKDASEFNIIGREDVERFDIPAKVDGSAKFGVDVVLPGMKVATINAAPVFGARVSKVDSTKAIAQKGVHKVVNLGDAVAVVADGYWAARKALALVDVSFSETGHEKLNSTDIFNKFGADLDAALENGNTNNDFTEGNIDQALSQAATSLNAEYSVPFLAHATMEPMNCTALVDGDTLQVWTGTQMPLLMRSKLADEFDFDEDKVTLNNMLLGGGFGRRANTDYAFQAVAIAMQMPGTPIKLIWSREEDTQHDHYRQAMISRFKGGLDESGKPTAWWNLFHDKHEPHEAPYIPYAISNQSIEYVESVSHVPFGPWRSVDHSAHAFFTESFIDEMAAAAEQDAFEFRQALLKHKPRVKAVLEAVANMADWGSSLPNGWGRGIAVHQSFGSIVAQVAVVNTSGNKLRVEHVYCAADPGIAVSPNGFTAQMESGIVYGLTAALFGDISIEKGAVKQSNFHDYPMLRMNQSPDINVQIINSGEAIGGGGEPGTPPIAPAVANAVYAATGRRLRNLPLKL